MTQRGTLSVVGWKDFQHYKDRDPPWIKVHRQLLDNYEFSRLHDASKAHLMGIWLLAARHQNQVPADPEWIAKRIGATEPVDLDLLQRHGFIAMEQDASTPPAPCQQLDHLEAEAEAEGEKTSGTNVPGAGRRVESSGQDVTDGQLVAAERALLWTPSHQPPAGWSEKRSISVYRALRAQGIIGSRILCAIEGLAALRRRGEVAWLPIGEPLTIKAVHHSRSGVLDMFAMAEDAAYRTDPKPEPRRREHAAPAVIADLVEGALVPARRLHG